MRSLYILLIILLITPKLVQGQELPENVKLLDREEIKNGVYLFKKNSAEDRVNNVKFEYLKRYSNNHYVVKISEETDEKSFPEGKFFSMSHKWKLSPKLRKDLITSPLYISIHTTDAEKFLQNSSFSILKQHKGFFVLKATAADLEVLLENPLVTHISEYSIPQKEAPVSFYDFSVNKINLAHHNFPEILAEDLHVSVKEEFFDTTDIDLKNRFEILGLENSNVDQHAGLIATLIAGGGNTGSRSRGVAPGSILSSSSFTNVFPASAEYYLSNNIFVENHSYGGPVQFEYGNEAAAYDEIVNEIPELVHVFSSGNAGLESPETGPYAGSAFANLTGNYKMAKNVITVGAVNKDKEVLARSSKGPANDGRIKPELVAYAEIGTSDAAALVSGSVLLLQDLYLQKEGEFPSVALVKAILFAGAEDVGPPQIDFSSGYGNLDANGSLEILKGNHFFTGSVPAAEKKTFDIHVSEAAEELKVVLSWIDPAAMPGDEITLINNLDLKVTGPNGNTWLPWVLDASNAESILKPAERGKDSLNPAELVTIKNAIPGKYVVEVSSENNSENQHFAVAYNIIPKEHFLWTFPTGTDAVSPSEETYLRWEESFSEETAKIEYRYGDGPWNLIDASVDLGSKAFKWQVPSGAGLAQLRMTTASEEFLSDPFAISPELEPEVLFNCENEILLAWERVEGATSYVLKNLDDLYLEEVAVVQDTSSLISKNGLSSEYLSVVPVFGNHEGRAGTTINYQNQGVQCYFQNFFALLEEEPSVTATLNLSTTYNIEKVEFVRRTNGMLTTVAEFSAPFSSTSLVINDKNVQDGINDFSAIIYLESGETIETNSIPIYVPGLNTLTVYPNPVRPGERLNIISRGDNLDLDVFDMRGQKVMDDELLQFMDRLEISIPSRGVYILRVSRKGKKVGVQKLIVQ